MSQVKTLQLLRDFGKPARPSELVRYAQERHLEDFNIENPMGRICEDLNRLAKWGIVTKEKRSHKNSVYTIQGGALEC